MQGNDELANLANQVKGEGAVQRTTRQFLRLFGSERRGKHVVSGIRNWMEKQNIRTVPDFEGAFIDSPITVLSDVEAPVNVASAPDPEGPARRISLLPAANHKPERVTPNDLLTTATTRMLLDGLSQLPVMEPDRVVKGVISWKSIGSRLATTGGDGNRVSEYMDALSQQQRFQLRPPLSMR